MVEGVSSAGGYCQWWRVFASGKCTQCTIKDTLRFYLSQMSRSTEKNVLLHFYMPLYILSVLLGILCDVPKMTIWSTSIFNKIFSYNI